MTDRHIFVTGGTGLVGAHILKLLLARGYRDITALKRPDSNMGLVTGFEKDIRWIEGDLMDTDALRTGMQNVDWVVHSGALISQDRALAEKMYVVNGQGTANVVNAALDQGAEKLLHISSISVFTRTGGEQHIDEETEWNRTAFTSEYGYSKYVAEMEVRRGQAEGLETAIINPSIILGPGNWHSGSSAIFGTIWNGLRMYPVGVNGYVDVRDVAHLAILRLELSTGPERMIANAQNMSYQDLFGRIAAVLNRRPPNIRVSPVLGELGWRVLKPLEWITGKQPLITRERARTTQCKLYFHNHRSLTVPGFQYTPMDRTLSDIAAAITQTAHKKFVPSTLSFLPHHEA